MLLALYDDFTIDSAACEEVLYRSISKTLIMSLDSSVGRIHFDFHGVLEMRYIDFNSLGYSAIIRTVDDYRPSVFEELDSKWLSNSASARPEILQLEENRYRHFIIPVEDGVWEILASQLIRIGT